MTPPPLSQPTVVVTHGTGSYPVYLAPGVLGEFPSLVSRHIPDRTAIVITDRTVEREIRGWERDANHPWRVPGSADPPPLATRRCTIAPGETSKTRTEWSRLTDELLAQDLRRDSALIAVGGGVVGDLAGFVAATYMRGIPIVHVPTTLIAMVDSSIGGKTGVDTAAGKNLVGAFHQPMIIVTDPRCLLTLPEDELRAGLGEVVKHAILADAAYFDWLERHATQLAERDLDTLTHLVVESVRIKAEIVEHDERDRGRRAHLNLGHTVAHGLEHATAYRLRHGSAVALGLVAESAMAEELGLADTALADRVQALLERLGLATTLEDAPSADMVLAAMGYDKKSSAGTLHFALPANIGTMAGGPGRWTTPVAGIPIIRRALARVGVD